MKNLTGIFLKAFAFFFIIFTIPKLVEYFFYPMYIRGRIWPPMDHIFLSGLITGGIPAILVVLVQVIYINRAARKYNVDSGDINYGMHQTMELEIEEPSLSVFENLKNNLPSKNWEIAHLDETKGVLRFKVSHKWQIPDDVVTIQLQPSGVNRTLVKVESNLDYWLRMSDNGNNFRNIQQVRQVLSH
ncbi:MAG: hypothetical protein IT262_23725 [Saprospiraceae bacterium]|nr:hypothetical protein [Saprospiraceae bacterium]